MQQHQYQCEICHYTVDHAVDGCPVCGEPFYWHVVGSGGISDMQRIAFLQMMEDLVEGNIDREFMTHGDQLWLPYSFWQYNPDGSILDTFAWIEGLKLVQHDNPQKSQYFVDVSKGAEGRVEPEEHPAHPAEPEEKGFDTQPFKVPRNLVRRPPPRGVAAANQAAENEPWHGRLFGPIMLGLFFVLMALSYLSLVVQHHRLASSHYSTSEVPDDAP